MSEKIPEFTELAYQFGPFFFALLFVLIVSVWASKALTEANTRDPKASITELKVRRIVFLSSWSFGLILVLVSIVSWWFQQDANHVFSGKIVGLTESEMVSSSDMYFRPIFHEVHPEAPRERDEQFLVVQNEPVQEGQSFTLRYSKGGGRVDRFVVACSVGVGASYRIEWSDSAEQNLFILVASPTHASIFGSTAMAAELTGLRLVLASASDPARSIERDIVGTLQSERSSLGAKINAVEQLAELDDDQFTKIMELETEKESMVQTLLDLSRHSDKELAYKARKVVEGRYDVQKTLVNKVASGDDRQFEQSLKILQRVEPVQAMAILDSAYESGQTQNLSKIAGLREDMRADSRTRAVIPTASKDGDRYYVQAEWELEDTAVVECLTELFHAELVHNRTIEDERVLMKDRTTRLVWWYSKEWAIWMAEKIEACGATTEFVGY